jgi:hypothetical protein
MHLLGRLALPSNHRPLGKLDWQRLSMEVWSTRVDCFEYATRTIHYRAATLRAGSRLFRTCRRRRTYQHRRQRLYQQHELVRQRRLGPHFVLDIHSWVGSDVCLARVNCIELTKTLRTMTTERLFSASVQSITAHITTNFSERLIIQMPQISYTIVILCYFRLYY